MLDATGDGRDDILVVRPRRRPAPTAGTSVRGASQHLADARTDGRSGGRPTVGDFDGDGLEDVLIVAPGRPPTPSGTRRPTGVDARAVSVNGTYAIAAGPMDAAAARTATDDVLFVSQRRRTTSGRARPTGRSSPRTVG